MRKKTSYEELKDLWYKKLKDSGFEDIEGNEDNLKTWSSAFNRKGKGRELIESKTTYYQLATDFLNDFKFETELDKIIWNYHTEGIGVRDIAKLLKDAKILDTNHVNIWRRVVNLENIMKQTYLSGYQKIDE